MDLGIAGRRAIVCASSKGLGRACAQTLAEAGCSVIINGRNAEQLEQTAAELRKRTGAEIVTIAADVSTSEGQQRLLEACPEPDILINNNAGPPFRDFRELHRQSMIDGVVANMITPIELVQRVVDGMSRRRFGRIVNITSSAVLSPIPGLDLSSGARAGLTAFLAGVARTVAEHNVTINHLLPGSFATDRLQLAVERTAKQHGRSIDEEEAERQRTIPARRFGDPTEFGAACAFLCSAQAGYITGQNILIDGGAYRSSF